MELEELRIIAQTITNLFSPIGETSVIELLDNKYITEQFSMKFGESEKTERINKKIYAELKATWEAKIPQYYARIHKGKNWKCAVIPYENKAQKFMLVINFDTAFFYSIKTFIDQFISDSIKKVESKQMTKKNIFTTQSKIQDLIGDYCFKNTLNPFNLNKKHKEDIVKMLKEEGILELKNSINLSAQILGVTRATIYNYLK